MRVDIARGTDDGWEVYTRRFYMILVLRSGISSVRSIPATASTTTERPEQRSISGELCHYGVEAERAILRYKSPCIETIEGPG